MADDNVGLNAKIRVKADLNEFRRDIQKEVLKMEKKGFDLSGKADIKKGPEFLFKQFQQQIGGMGLAQKLGNVGTGAKLGAKAGLEGGGLIGMISGGLKGITMALGPIGIAATVIIAIASTFRSVQAIAGSILKVLYEFLRPIADVITIFLMPILAILRPILRVFQAIMMPFRKIAMQFAGEGMKAIGQGDIGGGMQMSLMAFSTLFAGIEMVILGMLEKVLVGLYKMLGEAAKIVMAPVWIIADMIAAAIDGLFGTNFQEKVAMAKETFNFAIDTWVDLAEEMLDTIMGTLMMGALTNIKDAAISLFGSEKAEKIVGPLDTIGKAVDGIFGKSLISFEDMGKKLDIGFAEGKSGIENLFTTLTSSASEAGDRVKAKFDSLFADFKKRQDEAIASLKKSSSKTEKSLMDKIAGALGGAAIGGAIGSLAGPVGTTVGAIGGAVYGYNKKDDFVMRPGQSPQAFSPNDTIFGVKNPQNLSLGGGQTINMTVNVQGSMGSSDSELRRLAQKLADITTAELRRRVTY